MKTQRIRCVIRDIYEKNYGNHKSLEILQDFCGFIVLTLSYMTLIKITSYEATSKILLYFIVP